MQLASWNASIILVRSCLKSLLLANMWIVSIFWMSFSNLKCCSYSKQYLWVPYLSTFDHLEEYPIASITVG